MHGRRGLERARVSSRTRDKLTSSPRIPTSWGREEEAMVRRERKRRKGVGERTVRRGWEEVTEELVGGQVRQ
jgi:hypothetical protein